MAFTRRFVGVLVGVAFAVQMSGCAAIFHGTSQQVSIRSNQPDAELYVNEAYVGKGNAVTVFKKRQNYTITVRKDGCEPATVPVEKSFDATTLLGIFLDFGIISILVVDGAATGAWSDFSQTSYVIDPKCMSVAPGIQSSSLRGAGTSL